MANENFYDILNISKDASPDEIKKAYREKAKQFHPDKNKAPEAAEKFKMISKAHEVLSNPAERRKYDDAKRNGFDYDNDNSSWSRPNMADAKEWTEWFKNVFNECGGKSRLLTLL